MQKPQKLNVIMSDVPSGKISAYIPAILRHACAVEVERVAHQIPPEYSRSKNEMKARYIKSAKEKAQRADLIIIPGGRDINPRLYGQYRDSQTDKPTPTNQRDEVEEVLIGEALKNNIPLLMICRGFQLGFVIIADDKELSKRTFCQHLPRKTKAIHRASFYDGDEIDFNLQYIPGGFAEDLLANRRSPIIQHENVTHDVVIQKGTITHEIYRQLLGLPASYDENILVAETSKHHQGICLGKEHTLPNGMLCSAVSAAGDAITIMEGFEKQDHPFCVGMQWHPEANATGKVANMFRTIVSYAGFHKANPDVSFNEWAISYAAERSKA